MKNEASILEGILQNIHTKTPFHVQLPTKNKLVFNKIVPYLFVYRIDQQEDPMLAELVKTEYSYLAIHDADFPVQKWLEPIAQKLVEEFGGCLIIEAWVAPRTQRNDVDLLITRKNIQSVAQYLLKHIHGERTALSAEVITSTKATGPEDASPLIDFKEKKNNQVQYIGLRVKDTYLHGKHEILPILMRQFRETLSKSLSSTFFEFIRIHTTAKPTEFKITHQSEISPLVWEIDQQLAKESQRFDFLLLITPVNAHEAWLQFKKDNFRKAPVFQYRPMPIDPDIIKRNLYNLRIEDLYDPTIAYLFRDKRRELDAMMTMLSERGKEGFMLGSLQIFGNVAESLLDKAKAILTITEEDTEIRTNAQDIMQAKEFAALAEQEIAYLKAQHPEFNTTVRLRDDVSGVMVNQGVLNISKQYSLPRNRAQALIQHEVGTHIVTYFNGKQQPFNLFKLGVPGYEKLQEGLAVLSEYMVGELTNDRLRILAGRVVAVYHMIAGNKFVDTFSMLVERYNFSHETAFQMTMRVYRSGGLTKDALYLQGLIELVKYIKDGHDITLLMMGKIRKEYIPIIQELMLKGIIKSPSLHPRYLEKPYLHKLDALRKSTGIFKMIQ
ncbi:flavohemoglobin expression-modulating QEGLA motif protein [Sphingobacterium chungjuense]|uniref:flavohemoglobin expression-modulating QEGLA motif protein n=1 Tax=Sphingobacterium chungjuense TaxID=2675553 RepID=UPI00140C35DC|nr:tyrosine/phenylalanine carboxypeptidase domain-containing protein [Sphingobacterium chungjuense]